MSLNSQLRVLPSVDEVLRSPSLQPVLARVPRSVAVQACRQALEVARARVRQGDAAVLSDDDVVRALEQVATPRLRRVINATGVVLHTNLGRAPLAQRAIDRVSEIARGACNLELDLDDGERGSRHDAVSDLLIALTGAEAALVVNNCAAAVLLTLSALGGAREGIVSRGELVEIGGGFRMPDVMRQSGVRLVEVGTTNRTRLSDYEAAIGPDTALLVKVHPSNFAISGFTEAVTVSELSTLGRSRKVPLFHDLGSGALTPLHAEGLGLEPTVAGSIAAGADVVAFSGDKLLGGPQAGVIVGRADLIATLSKHPLMRALRIDKLTLAALEATLELYRDGVADRDVPVRALTRQPLPALRDRAERLAASIAPAFRPRVTTCHSTLGGGSMPGSQLPSFAVALGASDARTLHERLRGGAPPVIARLSDGEVWLDVRCLDEADVATVAACVDRAGGERRW